MQNWVSIAPGLQYLQGSLSPLSAEVGLVRGKDKTYLFDVGFGEETLRRLREVSGPTAAILSHFHQDHAGNRAALAPDEVYLGAFTEKYAGPGIIVREPLVIDDGVHLRILPVPNSHAKDSLALEVDETWLFLGDAAYTGRHKGVSCYNATQLQALIRFLRQSPAPFLLLSHGEPYIQKKEDVLALLEAAYTERDPKDAFIYI